MRALHGRSDGKFGVSSVIRGLHLRPVTLARNRGSSLMRSLRMGSSVVNLAMVTFVGSAASAWSAAAAAAGSISVPMVTIGNPGNPPDGAGGGAVGYTYQIGTYEVTNAQYAHFPNAVDPVGSTE